MRQRHERSGASLDEATRVLILIVAEQHPPQRLPERPHERRPAQPRQAVEHPQGDVHRAVPGDAFAAAVRNPGPADALASRAGPGAAAAGGPERQRGLLRVSAAFAGHGGSHRRDTATGGKSTTNYCVCKQYCCKKEPSPPRLKRAMFGRVVHALSTATVPQSTKSRWGKGGQPDARTEFETGDVLSVGAFPGRSVQVVGVGLSTQLLCR